MGNFQAMLSDSTIDIQKYIIFLKMAEPQKAIAAGLSLPREI